MEEQVYFHSTPKANWDGIQREGLVPQIGPRSEVIESESLVFMFKSEDDLDNALINWFGELFEDEDDDFELVTMKITLPDDFEILFDENVGYECMSKKPIPPEFIEFFRFD